MSHDFWRLSSVRAIRSLDTSGGAKLRGRVGRPEDAGWNDFSLILGATLTLLGLIVGFTFSMAIDRCDQRKSYEEEEANAIGIGYLRAVLLPGAAA